MQTKPTLPDFQELLNKLNKKEAEVETKPEPVSVPKPKVIGEISESMQWAADQPERERRSRASEYERERVAWVDRCETVEECRNRMWKEKIAASNAWYAQMGGRPDGV